MHALYHHRTQGRDVEAVHIHGIAGGLKQLGYQVEIVGPPGVTTDPNQVATGERKAPGMWSRVARQMPQALFELMEIGYNAVAVPRLWKRCREERSALICERYALYNAAGVLVGRLTGTPLVLEVNWTAHDDMTRQGKSLKMPCLARWFERQIFRLASGIVVVSGYLRDQLVAQGVPAERIRVTPNAVDAGQLDPQRVSGEAVRERHGLAGKTVVGFAGSFAKWHRVDLLIDTCAALMTDFPDLRLLLVGDGAYRAEAEARVAELRISDRVVFTGKVPHAQIAEHMASMDVGVMPASNRFGSPMKVFEYMAMGRPAVAPRYQPLEEAIVDGETGLLFEPEAPEGLGVCLRALLQDPERRRTMGEAARRKVVTQHQWVHNAQAVVDLAQRTQPERAERTLVPEGPGA